MPQGMILSSPGPAGHPSYMFPACPHGQDFFSLLSCYSTTPGLFQGLFIFKRITNKKIKSTIKSMEGKKEAEVLRDCLSFLKFNGIFCWRQNTGSFKTERGQYFKSGLPGTPDILGVLPDGRFLGVECKREKGGRVSPAQQYVIKELLDSHAAVFVVHSVEELEQKLRIFTKRTKPLEDITDGQ